MGTGEQELKLKATVAGAKEAARDIGEVGKATEQVGKNTEQAGKLTDKATQEAKAHTEEQKNLHAASSDYVDILRKIHPALGELADATIKAVGVSGDLANKQIDLKEMLDAATKAAKGNAAALKLVGSSGAVVLAVMAIIAAFHKMREEAQRVTQSIREMNRELNELEANRIEAAKALEQESARRGEGPYTGPESALAMQAYERLGAKAPYLGEDARRQAVLTGGADASIDRLERIAVLFESGKAWHGPDDLIGRDAGSRESVLEMQLEHFAKEIDTVIKREREQARETMVKRAMEEANAGLPATSVHIAEFIKTLPGPIAEGMSPEVLAEVVQALQGLGEPLIRNMPWEDDFNKEYRNLLLTRRQLKGEGVEGPGLEVHTIRSAEMILQQLQKAAEALNEAAGKLNASAAGGTHYHNDKYVVAPGSASTVGKGRLAVAGD